MHIAFVPALSWKILTQTILSGDRRYSVWSSNKKEPSHQMFSKQSVGIPVLQAAKDWTGPYLSEPHEHMGGPNCTLRQQTPLILASANVKF